MLTVDHYYRIREKVIREGVSQREAARQLGHSRKTIKKALNHPTPPGYQRQGTPRRPVLEKFIPIIDEWLKQDKTRPVKQRHTAQRIYERLRDDYKFTGHPSTVRRYVAQRQATGGEVYFPLVFDPGEEAQVDWGEAWCVLGGVLMKVFLFCMRLCHSTASFVQAYQRESQEALLDGHIKAFEFFGGVPRRGAYDNLKSVVITVGKGQDRELTSKFKEFRSHYVFETRFCNVACGNEKGHVENLVKHTQRSFMTPLPDMLDIESLNAHLRTECTKDLDRTVERKGKTRRELLAEELERMIPLPSIPFEACRKESTVATKQALVRFDTNDYSVPVRWAHHPVTLKGFVDRVEIHGAHERVAMHNRSYGQREYILDPHHYIPLLERKPGGIHNGRPFKGEPWGPDFDRMRVELEFRYGGEGTKKFVNILLLFAEFPEVAVKQAVHVCMTRSAYSDEAVRGVLNYVPPRRIGTLDLSRRPELILEGNGIRPSSVYNTLLQRKEAPV